MIRQRSHSEELEEQVFEQVRAKMSKQNSVEEKKGVEIASVDKWEEESIREPSIAPDELIDEELEEEEEEELSDDDRPWLDEEIVPERVEMREEEIYHPRIMIPRNEPIKQDPPFEILTKPNALPDPNFKPKPILKKPEFIKPTIQSIVKPITETLISPAVPVVEEATSGIKTQFRQSESLLSPMASVSTPRSISPIPEKPKRKTLPIKESKFLKNITALSPLKPKKLIPKLPEESKWVQPTIVEQVLEKPQPVIVITAAEAAKKKRLESRQSSLEENKVAIDFYTDIVREFGHTKKQPVPLLLDTNSLKKAAESQSDDETLETAPIVIRKSPEPKSRQRLRKSKSPSPKKETKPPPILEGVDDKKLMRALQKIEQGNYGKNKTEKAESKRLEPKPSIEKPSPQASPTGSTDELKQVLTLEDAELKARSFFDYVTDIAMLIVSFYLYLFYDARLAIPLLMLMAYRQLRNEVVNYCPLWLRNRFKKYK